MVKVSKKVMKPQAGKAMIGTNKKENKKKKASTLVKQRLEIVKQNASKKKKNIMKGSIKKEKYDDEEEEFEAEEMEELKSVEEKNADSSNKQENAKSKMKSSKNSSKNKPIITDEMRKRTILVDNLKFNIKKESLEEFFSQYGQVEDITIKLHPDSLSTTITIETHSRIRFVDEESAQKALVSNGCIFNGTVIDVRPYLWRKDGLHKNDSLNSIIVKNISDGIQVQELAKIFADCGSVDVFLPRTKGAYLLGGCRLRFADKQSAEKALKKKRIFLRNRWLEILPYSEDVTLNSSDNMQVEQDKFKAPFKGHVGHSSSHRGRGMRGGRGFGQERGSGRGFRGGRGFGRGFRGGRGESRGRGEGRGFGRGRGFGGSRGNSRGSGRGFTKGKGSFKAAE